MLQTRELLSGLGEAHSAFVTTLMLQRAGVQARFVDLSGWRDEGEVTLTSASWRAMEGVDRIPRMPIVTGYAQCREGLMREFDRGYSEVTFSDLAALTGAREAIIHKEFHLSSADPNLVGAMPCASWGAPITTWPTSCRTWGWRRSTPRPPRPCARRTCRCA